MRSPSIPILARRSCVARKFPGVVQTGGSGAQRGASRFRPLIPRIVLSSVDGGVEDVDSAEAGDGAAVADGVRLGRFAFAVVRGAVHFISCFSAQAVAGVPDSGVAGLIGYVPEHRADFALLDFPKRLAAELEIVA